MGGEEDGSSETSRQPTHLAVTLGEVPSPACQAHPTQHVLLQNKDAHKACGARGRAGARDSTHSSPPRAPGAGCLHPRHQARPPRLYAFSRLLCLRQFCRSSPQQPPPRPSRGPFSCRIPSSTCPRWPAGLGQRRLGPEPQRTEVGLWGACPPHVPLHELTQAPRCRDGAPCCGPGSAGRRPSRPARGQAATKSPQRQSTLSQVTDRGESRAYKNSRKFLESWVPGGR